MITKKKLKSFLIFLGLCFLFFPQKSNALSFLNKDTKENIKLETSTTSDWAGFNPSATTPEAIIAEIIKIALSFLGVIFIILTIYAGFLWMTAMGESDKITTAKDIFYSSVMGLVIVLSAYILTDYIFTSLGEAIGV